MTEIALESLLSSTICPEKLLSNVRLIAHLQFTVKFSTRKYLKKLRSRKNPRKLSFLSHYPISPIGAKNR
jgi:hypothetical protein